jgi:hypothetical protein
MPHSEKAYKQRSTTTQNMPRTKKKTTARERIQSKAIEVLKSYPKGIQFSELVEQVRQHLPEENPNNINTYIQALVKDKQSEVDRPDWGLFRLRSFGKAEEHEEETAITRVTEKEDLKFYESFADFLESESECTKAVKVGGKVFGEKWTTPDVVGKYELNPRALIRSDTVIVSAEIKANTDPNQLITAFGQACAYKVFSHKVYVVIPHTVKDEFKRKLESLCSILGIGLALFDNAHPEKPNYIIKVKAQRTEPDLYYANKYMPYLETDLWGS